MDEALRAKVNESREHYSQDRTPENHEAFEHAVKVFADWILRRKLPEDSTCRQQRKGIGEPRRLAQRAPQRAGDSCDSLSDIIGFQSRSPQGEWA
jgi:hypothetical protein